MNGQYAQLLGKTNQSEPSGKTLRPYYTHNIMAAKHSNPADNHTLHRIWATRSLLRQWRRYKMAQPLGKSVWYFLIDLNIHLPYKPAILLPGIYPRKIKTLYKNFHKSFIYNSQKLTINRKWRKKNYVYIIFWQVRLNEWLIYQPYQWAY